MNRLTLFTLLAFTPLSAFSQVYITPSIGYASGGEVETVNDDILDLKADTAYSLSIETDYDLGRIGLFYSNQTNDVDGVNLKSKLQYLHFQSALDYQLTHNLSSFLGLSIGTTYSDVDWVDDSLHFSAGAFAGLQYHFTDHFALQFEGRWLGTSMNSSVDSTCASNSTNSTCVIKYESDWVNQFQANVGFRFNF